MPQRAKEILPKIQLGGISRDAKSCSHVPLSALTPPHDFVGLAQLSKQPWTVFSSARIKCYGLNRTARPEQFFPMPEGNSSPPAQMI